MPLDLTPIRDALAKATPGRWYFRENEQTAASVTSQQIATVGSNTPSVDLQLCVLLRNNASAMIDRIEELEKENALIRSSKESITEDVMTLTKEVQRLTRELQAYKEAMKEVEGMEPDIDTLPLAPDVMSVSVIDDAWRSQRDAILSKLKERLSL